MKSHIRFLHAVPDVGPVDIYLGNTVVSRSLPYGEATPHMLTEAGRTRVRVLPAGQTEGEHLRNGIIIPEESVYTVVIGHPETYAELLPMEEPMLELPEGSGGLRAANFTTPAGSCDVWLRRENEEPEALFSDVNSQEVTEYAVLPAGEYSLEFRSPKGPTMAEALGISVQPGRFYTVYLLGRDQPEEEAFPVITVQMEDGNGAAAPCRPVPAAKN